jgi:hypothetical protein
MKIREIIGEALCAVAIFASGYGLMLIGYGMGW